MQGQYPLDTACTHLDVRRTRWESTSVPLVYMLTTCGIQTINNTKGLLFVDMPTSDSICVCTSGESVVVLRTTNATIMTAGWQYMPLTTHHKTRRRRAKCSSGMQKSLIKSTRADRWQNATTMTAGSNACHQQLITKRDEGPDASNIQKPKKSRRADRAINGVLGGWGQLKSAIG